MTSLAGADLAPLAALVEERFGLSMQADRMRDLERFVAERLEALGLDSERRYRELLLDRAGRSESEWRAVAGGLTVAESYFERESAHFRVFLDVALRSIRKEKAPGEPIRVLSAGSARGEEPYSIAIALVAAGQIDTRARPDVEIVGVELDEKRVLAAREGRYSEWALRQTSPLVVERFFERSERARKEYRVAAEIRRLVTFEARNLFDPDPAFWRPGAFDAIFCRNVLMYFTAAQAARLVARFARALAPGGWLFLGHAENLRGLSDAFELVHSHDTFYYRASGAGVRPVVEDRTVEAPQAIAGPPFPSGPLGTESLGTESLGTEWMSVIEGASRRIAALRSGGGGGVPREPRESPPANPPEPELLIGHAAQLASRGELPGAIRILENLLATDGLDPDLHYLMGFCRQHHTGDAQIARTHYETAAYLDPGFALPRLALGELAHRSGEADRARREYRQALELVPREDATRILLFGGGLGRSALAGLCRARLGESHGGAAS